MYLLCLSFARQFGKCGAELESGHYLIGEDHGLRVEWTDQGAELQDVD